ncbi:MAG: glycosyltransferase family 2 protein [Patescibacteria group bacterium]
MISIIIIHYKTKRLLKPCIEALLKQTYADKELIFIDNDSQDGSPEYMRENWPEVKVVANTFNTGYAGAGNQGIELSKGEYVFITNPDIILEPKYFEKAIARMEKDPGIAALTGKVVQYDFESGKATGLIDTTGLKITCGRRVVDRGQGEKDIGQYEKEEEVFGISGACPLYRREALEDAKICGEYLDNDFFMYKEDVDLSWRFQLFGWKCLYYPEITAYHGRGTGVFDRSDIRGVLKHRGELSKFQKYYSYKNQRLMQFKNETIGSFVRHFPWIIGKEIAHFGYMVFREPYLFKSMWAGMKQIPRILKKRKEIMKKRKDSILKWF